MTVALSWDFTSRITTSRAGSLRLTESGCDWEAENQEVKRKGPDRDLR
jgi:hypothetical protein